MSITKRFFGNTQDGTAVDIFTIKNSNGMTAEISNYGGILVSLLVPDKNGKLDDVVLGYETLEDYMKVGPFLGATIGRNSNRIDKARFNLNGVEYKLPNNEGENQLHGGNIGFDKVVWQAEIVEIDGKEGVQLSYFSKDGEEGFPGNVNVKLTYALSEDNAIELHYHAVSDKDTLVNLTNHSYFNLSGHASGTILDHKLWIDAEEFTPGDAKSIPTGEIQSVKGTPMDFTELTAVGARIEEKYDQLILGGGYDHNYILKVSGKTPEKFAEVVDDKSGRIMEVYTDKPGVQLYTGNFLNVTAGGKEGAAYTKRTGLCLETQFFPNAINEPNFPSPVLKAGEEYKYTTVYKFLNK